MGSTTEKNTFIPRGTGHGTLTLCKKNTFISSNCWPHFLKEAIEKVFSKPGIKFELVHLQQRFKLSVDYTEKILTLNWVWLSLSHINPESPG